MNKFYVLEIELSGPISPSDLPRLLQQIEELSPPMDKGVVLSGRAPIWLYACLVHHFHPTPFVACYDPRLSGAVVVASHTPGVGVGQVIDVEEREGFAVLSL